MRRAAVALAVLGAMAAASPAQGSRIVGRCGANLCQVNPATKKVERLTRNGRSGKNRKAYSGASVSRSGRRTAFWFGRDLYAARGNARRRRKLDTDGLPGQSFVRPDGRAVAFIESRFLPNLCPIGIFVCGGSYTPVLALQELRRKESTTVATRTVTSAWLGRRLLRDEDPSGEVPQRICVLRKNTDNDCERPVAAHPRFDVYSPAGSPDGRWVAGTLVRPDDADRLELDGRIGLFRASTGRLARVLTRRRTDSSPAFSPDSRRIAFNRGRALYVVRTRGGKARRVARRLVGPSWARR